jgi:hypothetical protein
MIREGKLIGDSESVLRIYALERGEPVEYIHVIQDDRTGEIVYEGRKTYR